MFRKLFACKTDHFINLHTSLYLCNYCLFIEDSRSELHDNQADDNKTLANQDNGGNRVIIEGVL